MVCVVALNSTSPSDSGGSAVPLFKRSVHSDRSEKVSSVLLEELMTLLEAPFEREKDDGANVNSADAYFRFCIGEQFVDFVLSKKSDDARVNSSSTHTERSF